MARITSVFRVDDVGFVKISRRQLPLVAGDNLMMLMDLTNKSLVIDCALAKGKELEDFSRKYHLLTLEELQKSLEVESSEFLSVLSQCVQCVGCRRSAERLFYQLNLSGHTPLDPVIIKPTGIITITEEKMKSPQALCTLLYKHNDILNDLLENQIKARKSSRCSLHSMDTFRSKPFSESWREIWNTMKQRCRDEIAVIETKELREALENYLKKHKFCQECRTKVEKAYTLLISEESSCKEKGFVPSLYSNIKRCLADKHIHIQNKIEFIDGLIRRAEPEVNGSYTKHRERHAKTLEIAQEEVLTCIGMVLYERLKKIYVSFREEERACQILAAVGVHALCRSFDMFVEKKQGISNLELLYKEMSRAEKAKEHKKEQKKLRKKMKKTEKKKLCGACENTNVTETEIKDDLSHINCESDGDICGKSIDGGYGSERSSQINSRTSSVISSPEGSEISCSEGFCNHNSSNQDDYQKLNLIPMEEQIDFSSTPSLLQMLEDLQKIEKEEVCYIPEEVVMEFKCRENKIKQLRQELRENLRQNFVQMCIKTRMAQNCKTTN